MAAEALAPHLHLRAYNVRIEPLEAYIDRELIERHRIDSAGLKFITNLVRDALSSHKKKNKALSLEMKVVVTLKHLAIGKFQLVMQAVLVQQSQQSAVF